MSTLVGIKRPPESGLAPISKSELLEVVGGDTSPSFEKDGMPGLRWSGDAHSRGMELNLQSGELWSAGSVDDAALRKMQDIARQLRARLITEEGEFFDYLDEPTGRATREPLTRGQILLRVYVVALAIAAVAFYFFHR